MLHVQEVEGLLRPDERALKAAAIRFGSPDITPALDVKEYYCQLAESLQVQLKTQNMPRQSYTHFNVSKQASWNCRYISACFTAEQIFF